MKHFRVILPALLLFCASAMPFAAGEESGESPEGKSEKNWTELFNGTDLTGWTTPDFGGSAKVTVEETEDGNVIRLKMGMMITGIVYENEFPTTNFELELEARRTGGHDFFATTTFPVGEGFCSFVTGGWGGSIFGLSSLNGYDASENSSSKCFVSKNNTWYKIRVCVTEKRIRCWVDDQEIVDWTRGKTRFTTRFEVQKSQPMGITNFCCDSEIRSIRFRELDEAEREAGEEN